jgi:hypothetical protein
MSHFVVKALTKWLWMVLILSRLSLGPSGGMADAVDSKSTAQKACGFESLLGQFFQTQFTYTFAFKPRQKLWQVDSDSPRLRSELTKTKKPRQKTQEYQNQFLMY